MSGAFLLIPSPEGLSDLVVVGLGHTVYWSGFSLIIFLVRFFLSVIILLAED